MGGKGASAERQGAAWVFLEDYKELVWSLLLLVATWTFTKPLSLFAFLFPVCVSTGYFYLQHCRAVGPMRWVKVCETL